MAVHNTEENFLRFWCIMGNKLNAAGILSNTFIAGSGATSVATFKTAVAAIAVQNVDANYVRQFNNMTQKMFDLFDGAVRVLTDAEIVSSVSTGTYAALKGEITEHSSSASAITSLDFGEQAMAS